MNEINGRTRPTPNQPLVVSSAVLFVPASAGTAWYWVGDLSESVDPRYADYLWMPWPFLEAYGTWIGLVSASALFATGAVLVAARRRSHVTAAAFFQVIVVALFAAWLGVAYRVTTAAVGGANIGGGLVVLATPVFSLATVVVVTWLGALRR